jgi:hypothetical protein
MCMFPFRERACQLDILKLPVLDIATVLGDPADSKWADTNAEYDAGAVPDSAGLASNPDSSRASRVATRKISAWPPGCSHLSSLRW